MSTDHELTNITLPPCSPSWQREDPIVIVVSSKTISREHQRENWLYWHVDQWEEFEGEDVLVLIGEGSYAGLFFLRGLKKVRRLEVVGIGKVVFSSEELERGGVEEMRICNIYFENVCFGTEAGTKVLELENVSFVDERDLVVTEVSVVSNSLMLIMRDCYFSSPLNLLIIHDAQIDSSTFSGCRGIKTSQVDNQSMWKGNVNIQIQGNTKLVMKNCLFDELNEGHAIEIQSHLSTKLHKMMHMVMPATVELNPLNIELFGNTVNSPSCHLCGIKRNDGVCLGPKAYQFELFKEIAENHSEIIVEGRRKYRQEIPVSPERDHCIQRWGLSEPFPFSESEKWSNYSRERLQVEYTQGTLSFNCENETQTYQDSIPMIRERIKRSLSSSTIAQNPTIENYSHQLMNRRIQIEMLLFCLGKNYPYLPKEIFSKIMYFVNFPDNVDLVLKNIYHTRIEANFDTRGNTEDIVQGVRIYSPHGINFVDFRHRLHIYRLYTCESIHAFIEGEKTLIYSHNRDNFQSTEDQEICTNETLNLIQSVLFGNPVFSPLKLLELIISSLYISYSPEPYLRAMKCLLSTNPNTALLPNESYLPEIHSQLSGPMTEPSQENLLSEFRSLLFK